jgi:hypothetical protein
MSCSQRLKGMLLRSSPTFGYTSYDISYSYENEDVALNTGMILREMLRHEPLCKILLHSDQCVPYTMACRCLKLLDRFYSFPHYIEDTPFGISCDAFANFKVCELISQLWARSNAYIYRKP